MGTRNFETSISLVLICTVVLVEVHGTCTTEYITRTDPDTHVTTKCCKISCPKNHQIKACAVNETADVCQVCPENTYQLDNITSDVNIPCQPHMCPPDTRKVFYFPETGCRVPCICDAGQGMVGLDACNCRKSKKRCDAGTELTIYDTCQPSNEAIERPSNVVIIPSNVEGNGSDKKEGDLIGSNEEPDSDNQDQGVIGNGGIIIIVVSVAIVLSSVIVITTVTVRKKRSLNQDVGSLGTGNQDVESLGTIPPEKETLIPTGRADEPLSQPPVPVAVVSPSVYYSRQSSASLPVSTENTGTRILVVGLQNDQSQLPSSFSARVGESFSSSILQDDESSETESFPSTSIQLEESSETDEENTHAKRFNVSCLEN